jgi:hypothetical protein
MKKVKLNIEFVMPEIRKAGLPNEEEIELAEEARRLFPGKVMKEILSVLNDAGAELISFQKQEMPDYISKIVRDMDSRERKTEKNTVQII